MFAVILLGLGFIMIAGIFPVAVQQSNATANETTGALVCRDALRAIQAIADTDTPATTLFPVAATVTPFNGNLLSAIATNCYFTSDRRFGWVGFYRRINATDPFAQVWVIALQNPNFADASYPPNVANGQLIPVPSQQTAFTLGPFTEPAPVSPSLITAQLAYSLSTGFSYAYLNETPPGTGSVPNATTGAYLLVADDTGAGNTPAGALIGRILRLGAENPTVPGDVVPAVPAPPPKLDIFQLEAGSDLQGTNEATPTATHAYIIGRAPDNTGAFTGPNQDIAAMSAFVRINTSN